MTKAVDRRGGWWLPYVGLALLIAGWLVQYGQDRAKHGQLEADVRRLTEQQRVDNLINYSEHPKWWQEILAAEETK